MRPTKKLVRVLLLAAVFSLVLCGFGLTALAAEGDDASAAGEGGFGPGMAYLGAGISTGVAAIGGGIAVGGGAPAAIGALTEDPKSFGKSLIFVALGEGIALYGMLISILILNKVP